VEFDFHTMFDLAYVLLTGFFFLLCWAFTKACDRL
jgi:hypothetical protein